MKKITAILALLLLVTFSAEAQEKFSANFEIGLGIPFVELNSSSYIGYKPNLAVNAGIGYQFDAASRLRLDVLSGQFNGNNESVFFQSQTYEGSISYEYNLLHLFGNKTSALKFNSRLGLGAGFMNSNLYDIITRERINEVPNPTSGNSYSLQTMILAGANIGIPLSDKIDLNIGYAHRLLWFQPWVDAFDPESFDTYGFVTVGLTYFLKSDLDKTKIEVDPKTYEALKLKADSSKAIASQLNRSTEKVARLEMSNQEKDMQMANLRTEMDSLKANPVPIITKELKPGRGENLVIKGSESSEKESESSNTTELGTEKYRVIVVSSPSRAGAQRFIDRTKLDTDDMVIVYVERLDTYRVIYKSSETIESARKSRGEARKYYKDAWITKF